MKARPRACEGAGDCNGDGMVAINELVLGVDILLGEAPLSSCSAMDTNDDLTVTIDEMIRAVANTIDGCFPASGT